MHLCFFYHTLFLPVNLIVFTLIIKVTGEANCFHLNQLGLTLTFPCELTKYTFHYA